MARIGDGLRFRPLIQLPLLTGLVAWLVACGSLTPLNVDPRSLLEPTDSDDPGVPGNGPVLDFFQVSAVGSSALVEFEVTHPDGIGNVNKFRVTVSGVTTSFNIPDQLEAWEASGGATAYGSVLVSDLGIDPCGKRSNLSFKGQAVDQDGHFSEEASDQISFGGSGQTMSETGNNSGSPMSVGQLAPGDVLCSNLADPNDQDWIEFQAKTSGDYTFTMAWTDTNADLDLYIKDHGNEADLGASLEPPGVQPEVIVCDNTDAQLLCGPLTANTFYYLTVTAFQGGSDYVITVE